VPLVFSAKHELGQMLISGAFPSAGAPRGLALAQ
jgi:hypothetical protein